MRDFVRRCCCCTNRVGRSSFTCSFTGVSGGLLGFPLKPLPGSPAGSRRMPPEQQQQQQPWRVPVPHPRVSRGGGTGATGGRRCATVWGLLAGAFWAVGGISWGSGGVPGFYLSFYYSLCVHQKLHQQFPKRQFPLWLELLKFFVIYR